MIHVMVPPLYLPLGTLQTYTWNDTMNMLTNQRNCLCQNDFQNQIFDGDVAGAG